MTSDIIMFDTVDDAQFPRGAQAYAAYIDGQVASQPNWSWVVAEFPNACHLSITLNADEDADALDIENGAATPQQATGWWQRQRNRGLERPCLYANASTMQASVVPLIRAGVIARPLVRLWSAHYAGQHICSPHPAGPSPSQWTARSGRTPRGAATWTSPFSSLTSSALLPHLSLSPHPPPPGRRPC